MSYIINNFKLIIQSAQDFLNEKENLNMIENISFEIAETFKNTGKILICGNGGSNCDAIHFAEEFTGRFRKNRPALPAISLSDSSHITCVGNDFGFNDIFSRGVEAFGLENDFFIGISTSGNSENIIKAVQSAKNQKLKTFALLGKNGGALKGMCDFELIIPGETSDRIQEIHMLILHTIIEGVERILFENLY